MINYKIYYKIITLIEQFNANYYILNDINYIKSNN